MLFFSKKKSDPGRPDPKWPWSLSEGGNVCRCVAWEAIRSGMEGLVPRQRQLPHSEQKDPKNDKKYWYIQSAIATKGPNQGKYTVGCGWPGETGPVLMERYDERLDEATEIFRREKPDLTGYENFFD